MKCPACTTRMRVIHTAHRIYGTRRRYVCPACGARVSTIENAVDDMHARARMPLDIDRMRRTIASRDVTISRLRRALRDPAGHADVLRTEKLRRAARETAQETGEPLAEIRRRFGL